MNLDNIFSKTKEVFESAYKKTGNIARAGKHKLDITALEAKLAKDYELLGRLYYSSVAENRKLNPKKTEALLAEIAAKNAQIEEMKNNPPSENDKAEKED